MDGTTPAAETGPVMVRDRMDETAVYGGKHSAVPADADRAHAARAAEQATAQRAVAEREADRAETQRIAARADTDGTPEAVRPDEPTVPAGPRPRASVLATLSLVAGVVAVLTVLTGALAGYGIVVGVLALLLAIGGISATSRRHVAGKSAALVGLLLGVGAIVLGLLAVTGSLSWLSTDGDTVGRVRQWLDSQFVNRI
ncbi:DUF308 domain-containing protein [Micromonospora pattaloongensis]|uniref:DUF308 domain-containing protein n=1 Tax=Micromonospora pattaloongensis TaxID=405436 RepID=UPI000B8303DC|nr:DUF308 domain-containing protein [Micromonospora pattaloongensis]